MFGACISLRNFSVGGTCEIEWKLCACPDLSCKSGLFIQCYCFCVVLNVLGVCSECHWSRPHSVTPPPHPNMCHPSLNINQARTKVKCCPHRCITPHMPPPSKHWCLSEIHWPVYKLAVLSDQGENQWNHHFVLSKRKEKMFSIKFWSQ